MPFSRALPLALAGLTLLPLPCPAAAPPPSFSYDALLAKALKAWGAPGAAVAVVRDDEVVYLRGAGVRAVGGKERVTPDTLFAVGSCTKAFTATALAVLLDEGKLDWDDKVRKHVPSFRLADPLADRDVTVRDLLCHRTGLARHDLLWYRAPWSVEETVRRMAFLEAKHSFRAKYEYNNLAYLAAGLVLASAGKAPWEEVVQKKLLNPLGMKGAVFTRGAVLKAPDHATPHRTGPGGKAVAIDWYPDDKQVRASGSLKAGARDLSRWVRMQLNGGTLDGTRVVSAEALAETHAGQVVIPPDKAARATATQRSYGLGWVVTDYRGHALVEHGGATDGFRARVLLLPKDKVGVVVLTNLQETGMVSATSQALLDRVLGLTAKDWHADYLARRKAAEASALAAVKAKLATRRPGTKPSLGLSAYAGSYKESAYGTVEVARVGKELVLSWSGFKVPLTHFHFNTFIAAEMKVAGGERLTAELASFSLSRDAKVEKLRFLGRTFTRVK